MGSMAAGLCPHSWRDILGHASFPKRYPQELYIAHPCEPFSRSLPRIPRTTFAVHCRARIPETRSAHRRDDPSRCSCEEGPKVEFSFTAHAPCGDPCSVLQRRLISASSVPDKGGDPPLHSKLTSFTRSTWRRSLILSIPTLIFPLTLVSSEDVASAAPPRSYSAPKAEKLAEGVELIIFQEGTGATPQPGDVAVVHYTGRLGAKQGWRFDSTFDHKDEYGGPDPFEFIVESPKVIRGLSVAVQSMKAGGIARAIIPPSAAYQTTEDEPLPPNFFDRQRLFTTVFNQTRLQNGEDATLGTVIFDLKLLTVRRKS